jgi:hypothetical protein
MVIQYQSEQCGLVHDWINQRLVLQIVTDVKRFRNEHPLCQHECVYDCKALIIEWIRRVQYQQFVNREQAKKHPETRKYPEQLFCFSNTFVLEMAQLFTHHFAIPASGQIKVNRSL